MHYADLSDEFYWQREMVDSYDAVAKKSGARIVLASGFCALAGELGSQLAISSSGLVGEELAIDAWLEGYNGGLSAGVIHTPRNSSYPKAWDSDPYVLAPGAPPSLKLDTKVEGMTYPAWAEGEGALVANIFGP